MAGVDGAIGVVRLALYHADAIVELRDDAILLVTCCVVGSDEGRVVGANLGKTHVFAVAELRKVITSLCIRRSSTGGGRGSARRICDASAG